MSSHFALPTSSCDDRRVHVSHPHRLTGPLGYIAWALEWHRITRRIDAEHAAGTRQQINRLAGTPLDTVLSTPGTLSVRLGGRAVTMRVTAPGPSEALTNASGRGDPVLLAGAGRYGRFWWVAFGTGDSGTARIVVLARRVVVAADPDAGGARRPHQVAPSRV